MKSLRNSALTWAFGIVAFVGQPVSADASGGGPGNPGLSVSVEIGAAKSVAAISTATRAALASGNSLAESKGRASGSSGVSTNSTTGRSGPATNGANTSYETKEPGDDSQPSDSSVY